MINVLLLLADGFEMYEAACFIDVFGWDKLEGSGTVQIVPVGAKAFVRSAFNNNMIVELTADNINPDDFSALALPGGFEEFGFYKSFNNLHFKNIIEHFSINRKPIATICTGALAIASMGLLRDKPATTYNQNPKRIEQLKNSGAVWLDKPIVESEYIITSQNPATAIEVAFRLLEILTGKPNTDKVKSLMGFTPQF